MNIRRAVVEDSRAIALMHVVAWQHAYRGIVPQAHLDHLSVENRARMWAEQFAQGNSETLIAEADGRVIGFVSFGTARDEPIVRDVGEIYAIYVDPAQWSTGVGRSLWDAALPRLRERRVARIVVWVLAENQKAIRFYERVGFTLSAGSEKSVNIGGEKLPELRYELAIA